MIEFTSLEHLEMYDRGSKNKGRICFGTFNEINEPFLGFSDDNSESETYLRKFERFRKSLIPVVTLKRLPEKYFCGGRVRKRNGKDVKPQRTKLRKSRIPDNRIEADPVGDVGCQSLNFDGPQKRKEGLRERKRRVLTADSGLVFKVPQDRDVEKENSVKAEHSMKGKIELEEKVANKRVRGRPKPSNRSRAMVKSQLINFDKSLGCEEDPRRSSYQIESHDSYKDDGDSVARIPDEGIVAIEGKHAHSAKSDSHIESTVGTKLPRSREKCLDKSANDNFDSQHLNDDSSQTPVDVIKRCSCHGEIECNRTYTDVSDSVLKVQDEDIIEEDVSVEAYSCTKSNVPREIIAGKQESAHNQHSIEFATHLDSCVETKHALNSEKRHTESGTEADSQLIIFDSSRRSEECSKCGFRHGEIECNASSVDVRTEVQKIADVMSVENPMKSEIHRRSAKCPETSEEDVESQLFNDSILQKSENGFHSDVISSIRKVPDEGILAEDFIVQAQLSAKSEVLPGVTAGKPESPSRIHKAAVEIESPLMNRTVDSSQNSKDGSKFCSGDDHIRCNGLFMGGPSVQKVPNKIIVEKDENNRTDLKKCMILPENVETQLLSSPSKLSGKSVVNVESQLLNPHCSQKLEGNLQHYSCQGEVKLKGLYLVDNVSLEGNREIQKGNEEAVQVQHSLKTEKTRQERKVEMELGSDSPCKSGVEVESHFVSIDKSLKCDKTLRGNSESVQTVLDEADFVEEKRMRTQLSVHRKIPAEFNLDEEGSVQSRSSEKSGIHHNTKQSAVFHQLENFLVNSTWKSIDYKESKDVITVDKVGLKPCSSEVQASLKRIWTLLKPCVVRLERVHDIEKMVRRAVHADAINYPVIIKGGQRIIGLRTHRRSFPVKQHSSVDVRPPRKRLSKTSSARNMDHLTKIDLSDGMALKKFCELNTVSLIDSDSDEENVAQPPVLEDCASSPVLPHPLEDRASSAILSAEREDCVCSSSQSKVKSELPKPTQSLDGLDPSADSCVCSSSESKVESELPNPTPSLDGLDPAVESVVSENPVPSGVQALNELGFLEHGSFHFGKEHPSESIWSDVLDFGDADGSGMEDSAAPRGKYFDLLPLPFEDHISSMNCAKEIEVDSISGKVNTPKELDETCLETMNMSSEMEEDLVERAERLCHDILDSNLSGKECLENDPLSNEDVQEPQFESSKPTLAQNVGAECLASFQSPGEMSLEVSHKRRSKEKHGKERKHESHSKLCDILDSIPSDKECVLKDILISSEDYERSKVTPANVGESEFLTSLINPGKVMKVSHVRRSKEKIGKERKHKAHYYSRGLGDNGTGQDETNEKIDKERKRGSRNDSSEMETNEIINKKGRKRRFRKDACEMETNELLGKERKHRFRNDSYEMGDHRTAEGVSFPVPKIKAVKSFTKKRIDLEYGRGNVSNNSLEAEKAEKELEYQLKKSWLTKSFKVEKENEESVDDAKSGEIKSEAKEEVPASETLYRDLSTIPYILKCNLQNRCRKCKNLNPCANANKKFKLFFTLTVGVGRRLSKPLMETLQNERGMSTISRTAAYIAASASVSRPTTILVPALPEVVKKILPVYHSNLLMQLVAETEELEKMEKKTISDMAIAETLQLKRALIAMKARYLESRTMPDSPQIDQTMPDSESIILQSVHPGNPFVYKSNQIIAMKSKVDRKFRFVRKCLVSILPNKGARSSEEDTKKSTDVTENQLTDSQGDKIHEAEIERNAEDDVDAPSVNQIYRSSLKKKSVSSICGNENHDESMEPLLKKLLLDPSCNGKHLNMHLNTSDSKVLGETVPEIPLDGPKSPAVACLSLKKLRSRKPLDCMVAGNSDDVNSSRSHNNSSSSSGISSVDSEEVVDIADENETDLNQAEARNGIIPVAEAPTRVQERAKTNECSPSNGLKDMDPSLAVCTQVAPDIERSESQLAKLLSSNSTSGNTKLSTVQDSVQTSGNVPDQNNPQIACEETPDVILIPDEFESIDLTTCEEEKFELTGGSFPKWAVICTSLPELGFIKVRKTTENLIIYDKAVVSEPLEVHTISELNKFLNARLANLNYSYQSRISLEWILVTSGYLNVKTILPTNPLFWLPSVTARKTLSDMRNFAKRYGMPQTNTGASFTVSTSLGRSSSLSNSQTTKNGQIKLALKPQLNVVPTRKGLTKLNIDTAGKIVRINGQTVVMGTPVSYGKTQKDKPNPSSSAGQTVVSQVRSAQVVSSVSCAQVISSISSGKPLVSATPLPTPINRFLVVTGSSSVPFTSGPRPVQPGLIYTNSPNGYVRMASNPASSVVQANSPACSAKSSSSVPNQQSSSSPLFLVLPTTTTASGQSTSFRLTPSQPVTVNSVVSSADRCPAIPPRQTAPMHLTPVSSASKIQTPLSTASGLRQTTAFRIPLVPSASRSQTLSSLPGRRVGQTTTIRRPFRQIVVTPGSVRCVNLTRIAPGSIATSGILQATSTVQSNQKTAGPASAVPKQVSAAPAHNQESAALAAQQVSAAPVPIKVSAAPAPNPVSAALAPQEVSAAPAPIQVSAAAAPKQLPTSPEPKQVLSAPAPQQESAAALPSFNAPVTLAAVTGQAHTATTAASSLKPQTASTSVCASTALSQKLAEALSQKLGQKVGNRSNPPNNRQILILRKGSLDKVKTSNPIKLVFQKPEIPPPSSSFL